MNLRHKSVGIFLIKQQISYTQEQGDAKTTVQQCDWEMRRSNLITIQLPVNTTQKHDKMSIREPHRSTAATEGGLCTEGGWMTQTQLPARLIHTSSLLTFQTSRAPGVQLNL